MGKPVEQMFVHLTENEAISKLSLQNTLIHPKLSLEEKDKYYFTTDLKLP